MGLTHRYQNVLVICTSFCVVDAQSNFQRGSNVPSSILIASASSSQYCNASQNILTGAQFMTSSVRLQLKSLLSNHARLSEKIKKYLEVQHEVCRLILEPHALNELQC